MIANRFTMIHPGDMILVDFGTTSVRCQVMGRHPAFVVSHDDQGRAAGHLLVIPAFRKPSDGAGGSDVVIKSRCCTGLRYDMYLDVTNIQKVERHRVLEKLGHVSENGIMEMVRSAFYDRIGRTDERRESDAGEDED